ncbi:Fur family transcriptional regulator [Macrococcus equipercicus]|uniref:Ferric uptake regulation protein n=1 Tax=Macrococcus equipercicus TaxID=69967 RepID=A0A9Q9BU12_9STAP|nr:Fur family transcriptional regulator [Macrococcus equipercicus]KAA1040089.1 transcriptional repressor [Macrococcus equipercicus]UTH12962.1 transcriptional repressor [Macrococcus equipercicus]
MKIDEAIQVLKDKGYKYTDKRRDMVTILKDEDKYLSAKQIQLAMNDKYPGISFDTVYRNLHTFNELHIVETTEWAGEKKFRLACTNHHHHHFICESCGDTKVIEHCPMAVFQEEIPDVEIRSHKIELYGLCEKCK